MKVAVTVIILSLVVGCGTTVRQVAPAPLQRLPTATEVFNLRGKCAALADKLDEDMVYGANVSRQVTSLYRIQDNHCYVVLFDQNYMTREITNNLFDGQTRDLIASAETYMVGESVITFGMIYKDVIPHDDTIGTCNPSHDLDCGYSITNDYINRIMR